MSFAALADVGSAANVYLRPVQFVDSPVALDGWAARLAGGLLWHAGYELIVTAGGKRVIQQHVAVDAIDAAIAALPEPQGQAAAAIRARLAAPRAALVLGERTVRLDEPRIVGILNVTPDSFSDGGAHDGDPQGAADAGFAMAAAGAALIDAGGESTRPGAKPVWEGDEIARVVPVIERLAASGTPVSIDTRKAAVMEAALAAGARVVNDVSGLIWDARAAEVVAKAGCPVILMHSPDAAKGADGEARYGDVLLEVYDWLEARVGAAVAAGIDRAKIIVDPGIGFGKGVGVNLALLNGLALFQGLGCAVMLGASRKRLIGALSNEAPVGERLGGSVALALRGAALGVQLIRVHDVGETVQAVRVWRGMVDAGLVG